MAETKKVKRKRLSIKRLLIFLLFLYLIGSVIFYAFKMPIKNINITGNEYITDEEIIKLAKIEKYPAIFKVNSKKIKKVLKKSSLINDVKIKKSLNGTISFIIDENKPILYNKANETYIYQNGLEEKTDKVYVGIPIILNIIPDDVYKLFLESTKKIHHDVYLLISEIEYSPSMSKDGKIIDETRFLLRMNDNNTVYINIKNMDNLNYYKEAISPFDYDGILYLDTSSEENYVFSKY